MNAKTMTAIVREHGQPTAYADHEYVQELVFTQTDWRINAGPDDLMVPWYVSKDVAMSYAKIVCPWVEKNDPKFSWASRTLVSFSMFPPNPIKSATIGPVAEGHSDRWKVHVRAAYTD